MFQKLFLCFVAFQFATNSVETQETSLAEITSCPSEPCPVEDRFCTYERDSSTCECNVIMCCSIMYCQKGYEYCDSCDHCKCNEECPSDACPPSQSNFCYGIKDEFCNCQEVCCSPPDCEAGVDWSRCVSCDNCPCLDPPSPETSELPTTDISTPSTEDCSAPCPPSLSNFCYKMRAFWDDCQCHEVCCSPPLCERSGVDWANCVSCSQCPCLPVTPPSTPEFISTTSTAPPCSITCEEKQGCQTRLDFEACRCEYDCTSNDSTKPSRSMKCESVA